MKEKKQAIMCIHLPAKHEIIPQPLATDSLHIGRYLTHVFPASIDCFSYSPALCSWQGTLYGTLQQ